MQARPILPARMRIPPSGEKGASAGRRIVSSPLAPGSRHTSASPSSAGLRAASANVSPPAVRISPWRWPLAISSRITNGIPPAASKAFTSADPFG